MWFVDTNTCIFYARGNARVEKEWRRRRASEIALPLVVYGELLVGAEKSSHPERTFREIESFLESHKIIPVTRKVAEHYARIRAVLEKRGQIIGTNDLWIAATALAHDATLVTNNTTEFSRVPGLKVEDWSQP